MRSSNIIDSIHGAAAVSLVTATAAGWSLQEWATVLALLYTVMLIGERLVRWYAAWRKARDYRNWD